MAKDNKSKPNPDKEGDVTSHIRDSFSYYPPKQTNKARSDNEPDTPSDHVATPSEPHQKSESPKQTNKARSDNEPDTPSDHVATPSEPHQKSESQPSDE